ncbi:hypothetical protein PR048_022243 [Dryococelus australis]|uniref:Uncharacterized protein n=1 Tax=Dryococelus australis TaxID=614101 RepID=A0ABQ9H0I2_9NEOP|nr:hypothetical protein PR048_022243 [Dryococelus australis]
MKTSISALMPHIPINVPLACVSRTKSIMKGTRPELVLTYDSQKNFNLPKLPNKAAYYKRQIYLFNFTICEGISTSSQNKNNTYFYMWTEYACAKGSNQIASSLYHRFNKLTLDEVTTIRLFSDGCDGQNKIQTTIRTLSRWKLLEAPKHLFPIVGLSYIPPDRFDTVTNLGKDCEVGGWKLYSKEFLKSPGKWYFQFQKMKKIVPTMSKSGKSIMVEGEPFYNFESREPKTISKKGKTSSNFQIPDVVRAVRMNDAKINYVHTLLTLHFGEKWEENTQLSRFIIKCFNSRLHRWILAAPDEPSSGDPICPKDVL